MPDQQAQEPVPLTRRHPGVIWVTRRFQQHLDAVREILSDFMPHAREIDEKHFSVNTLVELENLPDTTRASLQSYMDSLFAEARAGEPPNLEPPDGDPTQNGADEAKGETFEIAIDLGRVQEIIGDRHFTNAFVQELETMLAGPLRVTILHNSLLAMAIGAFEVLVSGIATRFYVNHPKALDSDEKTFSFAELREFGDVDDAADEMISRRITAVMYGGLESWSDWFASNGKADLPDLAMHFDLVQEAFQRRHVVLHNGGIASRQYVRNVADPQVSVGERLPVEPDYLDQVFDELDVLGTRLGVLAQGTWEPERRDAAAANLLRRCYELMVEGRWEAAEALAATGKALKCEAAIKTSLQCNEWLCRAERHGYESIRDEVEREFDASTMSTRFKLVRHILVGNTDAAMTLVPEALETKEITLGELRGWPILRMIREHPGFADLLAKLEPDKASD
jgi:hypothetical protein